MQSADSLIQDYLAALRILDLEGPSVLGHDATGKVPAPASAAHRRIGPAQPQSRAGTAPATVDYDELKELDESRTQSCTRPPSSSRRVTVVVHLSVWMRVSS